MWLLGGDWVATGWRLCGDCVATGWRLCPECSVIIEDRNGSHFCDGVVTAFSVIFDDQSGSQIGDVISRLNNN